jgi:Ca-activated chloride channel family protein
MAADRGLRVYTIGFGTANGSSFPRCGQQFVGSEPSGGLGPPFGMGGFGGGGGGGGGFRRGIDEATLKRIAELTDGAYFSAESAGELNDVFATLPTTLITKNDTFEVTVAFAALGALLAGIALVLALLWHPLP